MAGIRMRKHDRIRFENPTPREGLCYSDPFTGKFYQNLTLAEYTRFCDAEERARAAAATAVAAQPKR